MTREEAHILVDRLFGEADFLETSQLITSKMEDASTTPPKLGIVGDTLEAPARELPKDKRVVRTKASGDRVYLLDEVKKTRQWVTNPDVLDSLGFELGDVGEVDEDEMLRYQMGPALYRRVDEQ